MDIFLELGVVAVGLHLAELKAAGSTKHDIDDAYIAERGDDPLPQRATCSEAYNIATCPH